MQRDIDYVLQKPVTPRARAATATVWTKSRIGAPLGLGIAREEARDARIGEREADDHLVGAGHETACRLQHRQRPRRPWSFPRCVKAVVPVSRSQG
jgi:hypothetical protein